MNMLDNKQAIILIGKNDEKSRILIIPKKGSKISEYASFERAKNELRR